MGFRHNHVLERYTPAEAETVTGVNVALQRDWRRRGLLPPTEGSHARYTASQLAEMVLMQDFAERKLGPKALKSMLGEAVDHLKIWVEAMPGNDRFVDIERAVPIDQLPARYVVFTGDKAISTASLDNTFGMDRRLAIVCNLRSVAEYVVAKVPRPVWKRKTPRSVQERA